MYSSVLGLQGDGFRRDTENPREAGGTIVAGGAGADAFVFAPSVLAAPNPVTHIADYSAAQGGDGVRFRRGIAPDRSIDANGQMISPLGGDE